MEKKDLKETLLWDSSLSEEERLTWLVGKLSLEEKLDCLSTGCPEISRLGIPEFFLGGEAAHGVQARHDQFGCTLEPAYTTVLSNPIGMSATWDTALIKKAGQMTGNEARGLFHTGKHDSLSVWAPTVDMERDARWGRTEEGYGEDPYLTAEMAGAYVDGLQGDHPRYFRCMATLKHFYANNEEKGRTYVSSSIDARNREEYYLVPFRLLIQEHRAQGMMAAYNEVNGVPCMLLKKQLRRAKEWGLSHIVCDGGDVSQTVEFHKYFSRHAETIAAGLSAGIDCFTDDLELVKEAAREALEREMITEEQIDEAVKNHFRVMLRLGFFDPKDQNPYAHIGAEAVGTKQNGALAYEVTAESAVLLKNDGILPLCADHVRKGKEKLLLAGPLCDVWFKDWYSGIPPYAVTPEKGIKNAVANALDGEKADDFSDVPGITVVSGESTVKIRIKGTDRYLGMVPAQGEENRGTVGLVSEAEAEEFILSAWERDQITLRAKSNGMLLATKDETEKGQDGRVCAQSTEAYGWYVKEVFYFLADGRLKNWEKKDLAVGKGSVLRCAKLGQTSGLFVELLPIKDGILTVKNQAERADTVCLFLGANPMISAREGTDRTELSLPEVQEKMLKEVCKVNPNVVVILISSIPYDLSFAKEHARAILTLAGGSMELGNGLADILFGKKSPAGRLNLTWVKSADDLPPMTDYDIIRKGRTYQYFEGQVLYPFGFGLTYSQIAYTRLTVEVKDQKSLDIALTVKNTGKVTTDEVVQIYARKVDPQLKQPKKRLIAFMRVKDIQPGEEKTVHFAVPEERLQYFDVIAGKMLTEPGDYVVEAGGNARDILLSETVTLAGTTRGKRDGLSRQKAELFDDAKNHVLFGGHLGDTAVCTAVDLAESAGVSADDREDTPVVLTYQNVYLPRKVRALTLDFWQEYPCEIRIRTDGADAGTIKTAGAKPEGAKQTGVWQASGEGARKAHENWLTARREIGWTQVDVPVKEVPVNREFTLEISWRGKGKLCSYRFV